MPRFVQFEAVSDVRDVTRSGEPVPLSARRRRLRVASFVVAVAAAIFGGFAAGVVFALTSACGFFETATAGAGKHEGGGFAALAFLLGVGELIFLGAVAWRRRTRVRYIVALPFALIAAYTVTLTVMWTVLRLIWGPTHCESTGFF